MNQSEIILNQEDVMQMLDSLLRDPVPFWDEFYRDREKKIPFFHNVPDENLVGYFEKGYLKPGRALELGCGPGRNAIYLAQKGCRVDAVDLSKEALNWGEERAREQNLPVRFIHQNIFDLDIEDGSYDFIYDSGCFHHLAPHRRLTYVELVNRALKPGGHFAVTCFVMGGSLGGSEISDWEVYRAQSVMGGLGYTEEKLKTIFRSFTAVEVRRMKVMGAGSSTFGVPDLWTALFKKE